MLARVSENALSPRAPTDSIGSPIAVEVMVGAIGVTAAEEGGNTNPPPDVLPASSGMWASETATDKNV